MPLAGPHYFIRHGQTDWNAEGRFQGQHDIPLNDFGRAQAAANGKTLAEHAGSAIADFNFVASPLARTRETMAILRGAIGLEEQTFSLADAMIELSFGDWEGHTEAELHAAYPQQMRERALDKWHYMPPGDDAESYETLSWRVASWLERLDRPTVCVTHGGVIRAIFKVTGTLNEFDAARFDIPQDRVLKMSDGKVEWLIRR